MKDKTYEIAINPRFDRYQRGLASIVYKYFDKKTGLGASVNKELPQELHKPVIKKNSKEEEFMRDLKIIFEQLIELKGDLYLLRIEVLNIYYVW